MIYNISGTSLSNAYDVAGVDLDYAYDISGEEVFSKGGGGGHDISDYENHIIEMIQYQTPCGQDFAYHDGMLVAATSTSDVLQVIDATTGTRPESAFTVSGLGHCNSIVFSPEFYDEGDTFPLLCTINGGLLYYRISNTYDSAQFVKRYILATPPVDTSTAWYGLGFHDGYLYTIGYTSGTYQWSASNFVILAKYDLQHPIDNGDNTFTLPIIYTKRIDWFECIQGSEVHDGYMWVTSGFTNPAHVFALDLTTAEILLDIEAEHGEWDLESEALSWVNDYTLLVGTKNQGSNTGMYRVTFPDLMPS